MLNIVKHSESNGNVKKTVDELSMHVLPGDFTGL